MKDTISLNRRSFLKTSTLATTGIVLNKNFAIGKPIFPSQTINIAIIGCGTRGTLHTKEFSRIPGVRIAAFCDVHKGRGNRLLEITKNKYPGQSKGVKLYTDFRDIIAREDIDAITIPLPDHWHAPVAVTAARAGKHIYIEKPFAYTIHQGQAIVNAVKQYGVVLQHGTQQRSMSTFKKAAELARNGRIGKVHTALAISPEGPIGGDPNPAPIPEELDYEMWLGPAPYTPYTPGRDTGAKGSGWYHIRDYSGGWVTAWGSHHVDSAQYAIGKDNEAPISVEGWGKFPKTGVYDTAYQWLVKYKYADDTKLVFGTLAEIQKEYPDIPHKGGMTLIGTKGWIVATRGQINTNPKSLLVEKIRPDEYHCHPSKNHFGNFIDVIYNGGRTAANEDIAHLSTTLCHLCNIAIEVQRPLKWDGKNQKFIKDPEANRMLASPMRAPWSMYV